ncbi:MAG: Rpn family recombination-promoting nuclease/putative transposase, partial [Fretibacterium sp.]|nr:Rpn family recombination-promoting nuclease/putative transposase [Fretibacterium sp.]
MGGQDISEKNLEWFNDVFADIVNVFFAINGIDSEVKPEDLRDARARTSYTVDDRLREQERDVVKFWLSPHGEAVICLVGMENQSAIDTYMPLRIMGYEGADYRGQVPPRRKKGMRCRAKKPHFVINIVLYFGTQRRWPARRSLQERLRVPEKYRKIVSDCPVNVLELAWLSNEEEALFKSEFRHFVHYLRQVRKGEKLDILPEPAVTHVTEFFALLKALTKDARYDSLVRQVSEGPGEGGTLMKWPSLIDAIRDEGWAQGLERGMEQGMSIGESQARRSIMENLIAGGMSPQDAARYTGL